jgi:pimeloyl-ACP methyl ester carboxylesterase
MRRPAKGQSFSNAVVCVQGVDNYMLEVLASDVKGAVQALGHSSCTLVAHDWGGCVAWVTAGMYGADLVEKLIVLGLPHVGISSTNMVPQQYLRSLYIMSFQVRSWFAPQQCTAHASCNCTSGALLLAVSRLRSRTAGRPCLQQAN